ncbi:MAG: PKD domain-containing protein, partial [Flavisolibacter sp.]|nr:PKD domain-containing protein [Flavisolibacter sp.]
MRFFIFLPFLLLFIFLTSSLFSQTNTYILNGSAKQDNCNCYTLTPATQFQSGSVWNRNKIDLSKPFDFWFNVNLGCLDATGADGIVFILQPISTSIGTSGEGMGFGGVSPSIGIALDTWQNFNLNDPSFDHISIQANGVIAHGNDLAGPVQASATSTNIEDCQWHVLRIVWNAATKQLQAYFDSSLRVEAKVDMVKDIFNNDPMVYWGFSAATGGFVNVHQFCTALNPDFTTNLPNNTTCFGPAPTVAFQNQSISFTTIKSYVWNFGDGSISTLSNPPAHEYTRPGVYEVKLEITGQDDCRNTTTKKINIGDKPVAQFSINDTCYGKQPSIKDESTVKVNTITEWNWQLDGGQPITQRQPLLTTVPTGQHTLTLSVTSNFGCTSDPVTKTFMIKPSPAINFEVKDGCAKAALLFSGIQTDNQTQIRQWTWNFNKEHSTQQQNTSYTFLNGGVKQVQLVALATNGCTSDTVSKSVFINEIKVSAGRDTLVAKDEPFKLNGKAEQSGTGGLSYNWSPSFGLDNPNASSPIAALQDDMQYILTVTSAEGCTAMDTIKIEVFKGSAIYVPNAFTPNGDGLNDVFRPRLTGITQLVQFSVYNRWGQKVFTTSE